MKIKCWNLGTTMKPWNAGTLRAIHLVKISTQKNRKSYKDDKISGFKTEIATELLKK